MQSVCVTVYANTAVAFLHASVNAYGNGKFPLGCSYVGVRCVGERCPMFDHDYTCTEIVICVLNLLQEYLY